MLNSKISRDLENGHDYVLGIRSEHVCMMVFLKAQFLFSDTNSLSMKTGGISE